MAPSTPKKPAKGASRPKEPLHSAASKDIWLAGLGAMAQAQAAAQEQIHEAAAHFNQLQVDHIMFPHKLQLSENVLRQAPKNFSLHTKD